MMWLLLMPLAIPAVICPTHRHDDVATIIAMLLLMRLMLLLLKWHGPQVVVVPVPVPASAPTRVVDDDDYKYPTVIDNDNEITDHPHAVEGSMM